MDCKKIIIIGIIILIVAICLIVILTTVKYDRINITPNGTSIEVPYNQTKYNGEFDGLKIWNWDKGILVTYNSNADDSLIKITEMGYNTLNDLIKNGKKEDIDGFTAYLISADELFEIKIFDVITVHYNGDFYCIPLYNETTNDNILICCNDKDMSAHMARSVEYKKVYPDKVDSNDTLSTIQNISDDSISKAKNITEEIESKANDYLKDKNLSEVKSSIENKARDYLSKNPLKIKGLSMEDM